MPPHNLATIATPRTLAHVLLDIAEARRAFNASWHKSHEGECLDRLDALSDEARTMIEAATGVTWDQISGASL